MRTYDAVDGEQLIAASQTAVLIGHAARYDARYVDGRMLLLAAHHVETEALGRLGQLDHARMRMTLGCRKRRHRGLLIGT